MDTDPRADTLARRARHEVAIKHSRFVAHAAPVDTPESAATFLAEIGDPTANHNCWAWRICDLYRFNDDGEPASTAGRPILSAIDGQRFDRVMVVVTRWFGGIKLGAGGLVRAYGGCAAECLRTAERKPLIEYRELHLAYPFEHTGAVHATLAQHGADKLSEQFDADGARLHLRLPTDRGDAFTAQLRDATRDQVCIQTTQ